MTQILDFLSENKYQIEYLYYAGLVTLIGLIIFKASLFKKIFSYDVIFLLIVVSYFGLNFLWKTDYNPTIYSVLAIVLVIIQLIKTTHYYQEEDKMKVSALNHIKNADYDYFVTVDDKDKMIDFSNSIAQKFGMGESDLRKSKFWDLFVSRFGIVGINEEPVDEERLAILKREYAKKVKFNISYQFRVQVRNIDNEIEYYQFLVKPIYNGERYLGKNIFINRNRWQIINELNTSLANMIDQYEKAKQQSHIWLSMVPQVLLYYDYHSQTYIITETFKRVLNTQKSELTETEFLDLIHPEDLEKYKSDLMNINSQEVTSIIFRLKINGKYRKISEEAMLMEPQSGLVSVVKTLPVKEENADNVEYIKSLTTPASPSINTQAIKTASTTMAAPKEDIKEIETSDDLKKLAEKMQNKDVDRLESLLNSAIKKRDS